jgi:hypothetical protein
VYSIIIISVLPAATQLVQAIVGASGWSARFNILKVCVRLRNWLGTQTRSV